MTGACPVPIRVKSGCCPVAQVNRSGSGPVHVRVLAGMAGLYPVRSGEGRRPLSGCGPVDVRLEGPGAIRVLSGCWPVQIRLNMVRVLAGMWPA